LTKLMDVAVAKSVAARLQRTPLDKNSR